MHRCILKARPGSQFSSRKRSRLSIIDRGRGWSAVEQRSKRIKPCTGAAVWETGTRHTWVVGKLRHLPDDCRLYVCSLDCGRWPASVNHRGLRVLKGILKSWKGRCTVQFASVLTAIFAVGGPDGRKALLWSDSTILQSVKGHLLNICL